MMKKTGAYGLCLSLGLVICSLISQTTQAAPSYASDSFWNKSAEGYWWYAKDKVKPKPKKKEEKKPVVVAEAKKAEEPPKKATGQGSAAPVFSAYWVEKNLEVYRRVAWDNPTVENLRAYLYLQRFAMDRSESFAYAGQMAVQGDPFLDEVARAPLGGSMSVLRQSYISAEQNHVLKQLFERVGVFFVFKNNCYICDEQAKILKMATKEFGVTVKAVSVDEVGPENPTAQLFPDYIVNPNIVNQLQIKALPSSFFLDAQTKDIKPLVQGFVTLSELNKRSITAAQKYNWLPPAAFDTVRPFDDVTSLSSVLNKDSQLARNLEGMKEETNPYGEDTNYIDPSLLVEQIKQAKDAQIPKNFIPRGF